CLNTTIMTQTIEVDDTIAPSLTAPANKTGASHVEGCDTSAISGLIYSETAVTITAAQLSTAGGSASDACGLSCITYKDSKSGSCPTTLTPYTTLFRSCLNTTIMTQTIEVNDTIAPSLTAPGSETGATHVEGCDTSAITGLTYSESAVTITAAQLSTAGGSASDACGISSISYQDNKTGSCPIVVTRTFTAKDVCLNTTIMTQTIEVNDTIAPNQTAPANKTAAKHVDGCDALDFFPTRRSSDLVTITAAQLSTAGGSASDACGISSITYQDSKTGSCPIVVTRTFTAKDLCQNTTIKTQTIEVNDT